MLKFKPGPFAPRSSIIHLLAVFGRSLGWNLVIGVVRQCSMGCGPDFFVGKPVSPVLRKILKKETFYHHSECFPRISNCSAFLVSISRFFRLVLFPASLRPCNTKVRCLRSCSFVLLSGSCLISFVSDLSCLFNLLYSCRVGNCVQILIYWWIAEEPPDYFWT